MAEQRTPMQRSTKIAGMSNASALNLPADFPLHTVSSSGEEEGDLTNFLNNCTFLTSINAHPDSPWYSSVDGVLYTKDGKTLISCPAGKRTAVIADGTEVIAARAFKECGSLTSMTVPGSVKRIGDKAFYNCKSMRNLTLAVAEYSLFCRLHRRPGVPLNADHIADAERGAQKDRRRSVLQMPEAENGIDPGFRRGAGGKSIQSLFRVDRSDRRQWYPRAGQSGVQRMHRPFHPCRIGFVPVMGTA